MSAVCSLRVSSTARKKWCSLLGRQPPIAGQGILTGLLAASDNGDL